MFAVIFEFKTRAGRWDDYYDRALALRGDVDRIDGFLEIERFANLGDPDRFLSLSLWRDEAAIAAWRSFAPHREAQGKGRAEIFEDYRLRVGEVVDEGGSVAISQGRALAGDGALFESIVTPGRLLMLGGPSASGEVERRLEVRVIRDYGMYERDQAPKAPDLEIARTKR